MLHRRAILASGLGWGMNKALAEERRPTAMPSGTLQNAETWVRHQLQIGISTHFGMHGVSTNTFEWLASSGADGLRDEAYWDHVEHVPGRLIIPSHVRAWYELAIRARLLPLLLLSYGNPAYQNGDLPTTDEGRSGFARYAAFVARSLPAIQQFQIWNEWELKGTAGKHGQANHYLQLVRAVAPVLRAERPNALVLPAGVHHTSFFNGYLESLVRGGLLAHVDGIALHTYRFDESDPSPEAWYAEMCHLSTQIAMWNPVRSGRGEQANLYITEMGVPSHLGHSGVTQAAQADYLERCILLAMLVPRLRGLWWYTLSDKGQTPWDSEDHYGLLKQNGKAKLSGLRLTLLLARLKAVVRVTIVDKRPSRWALQLYLNNGWSWLVQWAPDAKNDGVRAIDPPQAAFSPKLPALALNGTPVWTLKPPV